MSGGRSSRLDSASTEASSEPLRFLALAVLGAIMSGAVPLLLLAQVPDVGRSTAWVVTLAITVYAGVRLSAIIAVGVPRLFDFFFFVFVYVFMGLGPTVQIRSGMIARTTQGIDEGLDLPTALVVALGIACYEIGRFIDIARDAGRRRRPLERSGGSGLEVTSVPNPTRSLVLTALALLLSAYFVRSIGLGPLFASRDEASAARGAAWPDPAIRSIVYALAIYPLLVGIGALSQLRRTARPAAARWYTVAVIFSMGALLIVVNPLSSARYSLGTVFFALAVFAGAVVTPSRVRVTLIAALAGLIFIFPLADAFRRPEVNLVRDGFFGEYMGNPDYDAFWQVANALSYVVDELVQPGRQALGSALFWVPRAIWPDKPVDTGILLAEYRGYSFDNLSAPLWAELLVNGGLPLLIIGFVLTGFALRVMDRRLLPAFTSARYWAIIGAVFPVYTTILLRGSLLQATGAVFIAVACLLVVRERKQVYLPPEAISRDRGVRARR